ncbi:hypothetical protein N7492_001827 [Penicillium capsulatum]|uniref:Uncharacterized protein n=1 Tax=Penicillium capsulatum TaxID=69766 RepID=A0A9W9LZS9_9EURO|nr:hypothetical protein N7492_001827 [Penicillium capsulatum]KAJ6129124.1 hypothetical protein N7512_001904 [Penicillium capsulatum]
MPALTTGATLTLCGEPSMTATLIQGTSYHVQFSSCPSPSDFPSSWTIPTRHSTLDRVPSLPADLPSANAHHQRDINAKRKEPQNCSQRGFAAKKETWERYHMDDFMGKFVKKNNIKSLTALRSTAIREYDGGGIADANQDCVVGGSWDCHVPDPDKCNGTDTRQNQLLLLSDSTVMFGKFLNMLYDGVKEVMSSLTADVFEAVVKIVKPAVQATWGYIVTITGAMLAFVTMAAVLFAGTIPSLPLIGGALVGTAIGTSAVFVTVGAFQSFNEAKHPPSGNDYFIKATYYMNQGQSMLQSIQQSYENFDTVALGHSDIENLFRGGHWADEYTSDIFKKSGNSDRIARWFEQYMLSEIIAQMLHGENYMILFVPYGDNVEYHGKKRGFDRRECDIHWVGNPSWEYIAACDITFGNGGKPGMTLFARALSSRAQTKGLVKDIPFYDKTITAKDIMGSAVMAQGDHGFNYTVFDRDFKHDMSKDGSDAAKEFYQNMPVASPGLFNIPVCVIDDLENVPGVGQVMMDEVGGYTLNRQNQYYHTSDPCSCKHFTGKDHKGKKVKYIDFVSDKVKDGLNNCKQGGSHGD